MNPAKLEIQKREKEKEWGEDLKKDQKKYKHYFTNECLKKNCAGLSDLSNSLTNY